MLLNLPTNQNWKAFLKTYNTLKVAFTIGLSLLFFISKAQVIASCSHAIGENPFEVNKVSSLHASLLKEPKVKNPHTATMLAVFLPGAGQIYNEKFWKAPIVYAGLGISAYAILWNKKEMKGYQEELDSRITDTLEVNYLNLSIEQLKSNRDFYRTNRDISIMSFVVIYALQIVDAAVDAHLSEYNLGDDMTLKVEPKRYKNTNLSLGLTLTF